MSRAKVVLALGEAARAAVLARSHDDVEILQSEPCSPLDAVAIGDRDVELHVSHGPIAPLGARVAEAIDLSTGDSVTLTLGRTAGALDDRKAWGRAFEGLRLLHVEPVELGVSAILETGMSGSTEAGDTLWFVTGLLRARASAKAESTMPVVSVAPVVAPVRVRRRPANPSHAVRRQSRSARMRKLVKALLTEPRNAAALVVLVVTLSALAWRVFAYTHDLILALAAPLIVAALLGVLVLLLEMRRSVQRLRSELARSEQSRSDERLRSARRTKAAERRHRALVTNVEELANALAVLAATSVAKDLRKL